MNGFICQILIRDGSKRPYGYEKASHKRIFFTSHITIENWSPERLGKANIINILLGTPPKKDHAVRRHIARKRQASILLL